MAFAIGDRVEVCGNTVGFEKAYFAGKIRVVGEEAMQVELETQKANDCTAFKGFIEINRIRPYPDSFISTINKYDDVDVWMMGAWLWGKCDAVNETTYTVHFDFLPTWCCRSDYPKPNVRRHQFWIGRNLRSYWMFSEW